MHGEYLCARFQTEEGADCLAIWLPKGSVSSVAALRARYQELSEGYQFPVVVVTWIRSNDLRSCGDPKIIAYIDSLGGPETLDWRLTQFIDESV